MGRASAPGLLPAVAPVAGCNPCSLCAPPLTVLLFISGEAASAALPADGGRAALPHQTLQLREHHRRGGAVLAGPETALPQPQVGVSTCQSPCWHQLWRRHGSFFNVTCPGTPHQFAAEHFQEVWTVLLEQWILHEVPLANTHTHTHSYLVIRNSGKWAIMEGCLTPVCSTLWRMIVLSENSWSSERENTKWKGKWCVAGTGQCRHSELFVGLAHSFD